MDGTKIKDIQMSGLQIKTCTADIVDAMNRAQSELGFSIDQVLMATAVLLGTSIAQRGGILPLDKPLREALPPLCWGYERAIKKKQNS